MGGIAYHDCVVVGILSTNILDYFVVICTFYNFNISAHKFSCDKKISLLYMQCVLSPVNK